MDLPPAPPGPKTGFVFSDLSFFANHPSFRFLNFDIAAVTARRVRRTNTLSKTAKKAAKKAFDPQIFLAKLGPGKSALKFRTGQTVYAQGDTADSVFYIQEGKVKLTVVSKEGKEAVVAMLEAGQFFGEGCLNGQTVRIATTKTMEDSHIIAITKKGNDRNSRERAKILGNVHGLPVDPQQPD